MGKKEQVPALAMFVQGSLSKCSKNLTFFAARGPVFECCATKRTSPVGARSTHSGAQASTSVKAKPKGLGCTSGE